MAPPSRAAPASHIRPRSTAMVVTAITPWPHIVLHPSLCMNSTPACAPGVTGSVSSAPYMSACPRGSSMMARRRWSRCLAAQARLASMVAPSGVGRPSTTRRRGSPAVWASMVRILMNHGIRDILTHGAILDGSPARDGLGLGGDGAVSRPGGLHAGRAVRPGHAARRREGAGVPHPARAHRQGLLHRTHRQAAGRCQPLRSGRGRG